MKIIVLKFAYIIFLLYFCGVKCLKRKTLSVYEAHNILKSRHYDRLFYDQ